MKPILLAYKNYVLAVYDALFAKGYLLSAALMLGIILYVNYYIGLPQSGYLHLSFLFDYAIYAFPFVSAYLLQYFFYRDHSLFSSARFWLLVLLAPAFFALRVNADTASWWLSNNTSFYSKAIYASINYAGRSLLLMLPVIVCWYINDRKKMPLYGFTKTNNARLYPLLFLGMIPLLMLASGWESFSLVYPRSFHEAGLTLQSNPARYILFELCYGFDFLSIEFFFRGFLILAFVQYAGIRAIVPAACFYCCIHLGKPLPEAASSFLGGIILGVISYHTKSIWGGLFIHLGIAWLMEALAWFIHHA